MKLFSCMAGVGRCHGGSPVSIRTYAGCISQHFKTTQSLQVATRYCYALRQNDLGYRKDMLHTTTASLSADDKQQSQIHIMWGKFATKVRTFAAGVRALYGDMKLVNEYKAKHGKLVIGKKAPNLTSGVQTDLLYSRKELQFVNRTWHDVKQMLPTVVLFFIPFVGYIAPFLAFAYPEKLLSQHFWTPSLREDLERSAREAQKASFMALMDGLKRASDLDKDLEFIPKITAQFAGKEIETSANQESTLSKLSSDHLTGLYSSWGVRSLIPTQKSQQQLLQRHLQYVFVCDWLVHLEGGVVNLSQSELISTCMERGLHFDPKAGEEESAEEMRKKLDSWIRVSIQHKECPSLLLAYLPLAQYWTSES